MTGRAAVSAALGIEKGRIEGGYIPYQATLSSPYIDHRAAAPVPATCRPTGSGCSFCVSGRPPTFAGEWRELHRLCYSQIALGPAVRRGQALQDAANRARNGQLLAKRPAGVWRGAASTSAGLEIGACVERSCIPFTICQLVHSGSSYLKPGPGAAEVPAHAAEVPAYERAARRLMQPA
jgi:hypothetical protein